MSDEQRWPPLPKQHVDPWHRASDDELREEGRAAERAVWVARIEAARAAMEASARAAASEGQPTLASVRWVKHDAIAELVASTTKPEGDDGGGLLTGGIL